MDVLKSNITGIVKEFSSPDEDIEMLDTAGVVLKFNESAPAETIEWICNLMQKPILSGGANLTLKKFEVDPDESTAAIYVLSATLPQLFLAAQQYDLLKKTHGGELKPFVLEDSHDFENFEKDNEEFFTSAEKQVLIKSMLDYVVCDDESIKHVPGYQRVKVYKSRPVLPRCVAKKVLQIYPLHYFDTLKSLKSKWYVDYTSIKQPLDDIKQYFGETITLYFSFLEFYTKYLIPPAVLGFVYYFLFPWDGTDNVVFAVFNVIWATIFLELWKRKGATIVYDWGRLTNDSDTSVLLEKPRAEYKGYPRVSPITGLLEPYYPTWRYMLKMYLVTYPVLVLSLLFAMCGMWLYFEFKEHVLMRYNNEDELGFFMKILVFKIPGVMYAGVVFALNNLYGNIAVHLNDWENHRRQSSYDNHLTVKLALFYFINNFLSLFYIAFYLKDMVQLKQHLATLLITQQLIQQVQESVFPYLHYKRQNIKVQKKGNTIQVRKIRDPRNQVLKEANLPSYSTTFQDYLELFSQFGYVFMFSAVYPLAAFWALLNNIIEIRTDAFKLCNLHKRPFITPADSIGAWQIAFSAMSIISVMTNCALIAMSKNVQSYLVMTHAPIRYVIIFVAIEHIVIFVKFAIDYMIPDIPGEIKKKLAKQQYKTQQIIKEQELKQLYSKRRSMSSGSVQAP